jgi:hypothetical protein
MAHKKKRPAGPIPAGNQPHSGPPSQEPARTGDKAQTGGGAPFTDQDPKRRLGNYTGAGEHSYRQPGGRNDANSAS